MGAGRPDIDTTNSGGDGGSKPLSWWRRLPAFMAAALAITLLDGILRLTLDLPKGMSTTTPALFMVLIAAAFAKPETFRPLAIAVAVGVTVGAVAMLCDLPVKLFAWGLEPWPLSFMVRLLGLALVLLPGLWIVELAYRRLGVPLWETPTKERT